MKLSKFWLIAPGVGVFLLLPGSASAAPPTIDYLFPGGGQRGTTLTIDVAGKFERRPVNAWVDQPGVEVKAAKARGKLTVTIAPDAVPGTCWLRLYDEQGTSTLRPFVVGLLPEILEKEPNDDPKQPQVIETPNVTVNGRLAKDGDVDIFAVELRKGQTLVASMEAHRTLRSPMDGLLQVLSSDGFVLAQNDDFHEFDPQIAFTAPRDGRYLVRTFAFPAVPTQTIRYAGSDKFIYRLTLTTGGFIDYAFPLAVARAVPGEVEVIGWNLSDPLRNLIPVARAEANVATIFHAQFGNAAQVRLEPHTTAIKAMTNSRQHPQTITPPVTISGRLDKAGDVDAYEFAAKKGQKLSLAIESRTLGFPLDPVLKVTDAAGTILAQAQAQPKSLGNDSEMDFTPPQDGEYRVEVHDFHERGGPRFVYRLRAVPAEPDFVLKMASDRFGLVPGKPLDIPVTVERRNGFSGEIEIAALGLPDGVAAQPISAAKGSKSVALRLTGAGEPVSGSFRITGVAKDNQELKRQAHAVLAEYGVSTPELWLTMGANAVVIKDAPAKKK